VVRDYILDHGEILPEAMQRLQQRQATAIGAAASRGAGDAVPRRLGR
jgi:hypothetical protein